MSTELNGKTYNLPTVYDGQIVPPEEAIARAQQQGLDKFPSYGSSEEAELRYELMHQFMERDTADYSRSRSAGHARGGAADDDTFTDEDRTAVGRAWREPIEDRAHGGKLHYSQPLIRGQPPRGSYGLGRKTVDKLGNGDPKAGGFIVHQMFGIEDDPKDPTIVHGHVVRLLGGGDLAKGHKILQRFEQFVQRRQSRDGVTLQHDGLQRGNGDHGWTVRR